jgi:hypothetical protein
MGFPAEDMLSASQFAAGHVILTRINPHPHDTAMTPHFTSAAHHAH